MDHINDPQGLAHEGRPYDPRTVEIMGWLASPDGGAIGWDQAAHIAREIALCRVPHVGMIGPVTHNGWYCGDGGNIANATKGVMTTDGGKTWRNIE